MKESEEVIRRWTAAHDNGAVLQPPPKKPAYKKLTATGLVAAALTAALFGVLLGMGIAWAWR